ncbi:MAG: hypothetical protein ACOX0U_03030 [Oscillospiraceae bacterium]
MKQMICIAETTWRNHPGRTQSLISRLQQVNSLFFEPPVTWLALFLGRSARKRLKAHREAGRHVLPGLTVYSLPPILPFGHSFSLINKRNQRKLARYIRKKMTQHAFSSPILWVATEAGAGLPSLLSCRNVIYDSITPTPGNLLSEQEKSLLQDADLVFAPTPDMVEQLSFVHSNVALLPNGVDYELFAQPSSDEASDLPISASFSIPRPILGCTEPIRPETDLLPIACAARARPDWSFLFLGPGTSRAVQRLQKFPNVHFLHPHSQEIMARYVRRFDVCLSLQTPLSSPQDPLALRILEYLSTGQPIVACLYPNEIEYFPDVVYSSYNPQEFISLCARALDEQTTWFAQRRRAYGSAADWNVRVAEIVRLMEINGMLS